MKWYKDLDKCFCCGCDTCSIYYTAKALWKKGYSVEDFHRWQLAFHGCHEDESHEDYGKSCKQVYDEILGNKMDESSSSEEDLIDELIVCEKCKKEVPRKNLHWANSQEGCEGNILNSNHSNPTSICEKCHLKKELTCDWGADCNFHWCEFKHPERCKALRKKYQS